MSSSRIVTLSATMVLAGLVFASCESKEPFETCHLPTNILADCKSSILQDDQCREPEVYCYDTCLSNDNAQCLDGPCVVYEARRIGEDQPFSSGSNAFCTLGCHGLACPADSTCREITSLKVACDADDVCTREVGPWSRCEPVRKCQDSGRFCETSADCGGNVCEIDAEAARHCTFKLCVPDTYAPR